MKFKYTICLSIFLLMITIALPGYSGSSRGNADVCDPEIIGQIKKGESTKEDVKKLIGDPDKIEGAFNKGELWKYSYQVTMPTGSSFQQSGTDKGGSGRISIDKKNCNLHVYFEKSGVVRKVLKSDVSGGGSFMK